MLAVSVVMISPHLLIQFKNLYLFYRYNIGKMDCCLDTYQ